MLDTMTCRRPGFLAGRPIVLADGQAWMMPAPGGAGHAGGPYEALIAAVVTADSRSELLRAELALGIHLITRNYDLAPLILGALLDFPEGDPALGRLQDDLHVVAIEHVRAHRPASDDSVAPLPVPRIARKSGLFRRVRAAMSA